MKEIKDLELENQAKRDKEEKIVVYGEGCSNDCPHRHSWTTRKFIHASTSLETLIFLF